MIPLLAAVALAQGAPAMVHLDHYGAPAFQSTRSRVTCGSKSVVIEFTSDHRGVKLLAPRLAADPASHSRLSGLELKLSRIGNLRDWRVTCLGDDPIIVFRGYGNSSATAETIVVETHGGLVSDYNEHDPIM